MKLYPLILNLIYVAVLLVNMGVEANKKDSSAVFISLVLVVLFLASAICIWQLN